VIAVRLSSRVGRLSYSFFGIRQATMLSLSEEAVCQAPNNRLQRTVRHKVMAWTPLIGTAS
jgi:hypothetical protein